MLKWELRNSETCDYGYESQMTKHITTECPIRASFKGTMVDIHLARDVAVE